MKNMFFMPRLVILAGTKAARFTTEKPCGELFLPAANFISLLGFIFAGCI